MHEVLERKDLQTVELRKGLRGTHNNILQTLPTIQVLDEEETAKNNQKTYKTLPCFVKRQQAHFLLPEIPAAFSEKQPKIELFVKKAGHYHQVFNGLSDCSLREPTRQARRLNARKKKLASETNTPQSKAKSQPSQQQLGDAPMSSQRRGSRARKKRKFNSNEGGEEDSNEMRDAKSSESVKGESGDLNNGTIENENNKEKTRQETGNKVVRRNRLSQENDVGCICGQPDIGFMIGCDICRKWFHGDCVYISQEDAKDISTYVCEDCRTGLGKGKPQLPPSPPNNNKTQRAQEDNTVNKKSVPPPPATAGKGYVSLILPNQPFSLSFRPTPNFRERII